MFTLTVVWRLRHESSEDEPIIRVDRLQGQTTPTRILRARADYSCQPTTMTGCYDTNPASKSRLFVSTDYRDWTIRHESREQEPIIRVDRLQGLDDPTRIQRG